MSNPPLPSAPATPSTEPSQEPPTPASSSTAVSPMPGISSTGTPSAPAMSFTGMPSTSTTTFTGVPSASAWSSNSLPPISSLTAPPSIFAVPFAPPSAPVWSSSPLPPIISSTAPPSIFAVPFALPPAPGTPFTESPPQNPTPSSSSTALPSISTWSFTPLPSISAFTAPAPVPLWPDAPQRSKSTARFTTPPPKPTLKLLAFPNEILYNILEFLLPVDIKNIRSHPFVALSSTCRLLYHLIETRCFRALKNAAENPKFRNPPKQPFITARANCYRNILIRWLVRRCRYCLISSSRLAAMDESIRCCRPCDKNLHKLYGIVALRSAEEMWGVAESELLQNIPHGPHGDMRRSLVRGYVERKFGFDADLIRAARRAHILARPVAMDVHNSLQSREQAAERFWVDMREDWDLVFAQTGLVLKRPTNAQLDLIEAKFWEAFHTEEVRRRWRRMHRENAAAFALIREIEDDPHMRANWYCEVAGNNPDIILGRVKYEDVVQRLTEKYEERQASKKQRAADTVHSENFGFGTGGDWPGSYNVRV
ncbi:hypothetical protein BZA05DRAFT_438817 [Tricharina praecox]|uniref:uncharacterized protein n=1 Tax=Tricharina praecox TaxID=43433 RepID=UPI00221E40B1|nr:uncharacterized protein BZA05DRAFT_438817 [Tricharina praecox]KAI5844752.1 hypothetical protein BZA05DRAFT_438817 [Tricharina praecox]